MKRRIQVVACMVSFAFLLAVPSALAQADRLIGVWKVTEIKLPEVPEANREGNTITNPGPSIIIFTEKYHSMIGFRNKLPPDITRENMSVARQGFLASAGTYEINGQTIMFYVTVAADPTNIGSSFNTDFSFEGETLVISVQIPDLPAPVVQKFTRLE